MSINQKSDGDNGYVAFYNGRQADVYAKTALAAQQKAVEFFKPPKSKRHMVHVGLAERADGTQVVHVADF
jgi:hypothetical protein